MAELEEFESLNNTPNVTVGGDNINNGGDPVLPPEARKKLDAIVAKMAANNEPVGNVQMVVNDFKRKYLKTPQSQKPVNKGVQAWSTFKAPEKQKVGGVTMTSRDTKRLSELKEEKLRKSAPQINIKQLGITPDQEEALLSKDRNLLDEMPQDKKVYSMREFTDTMVRDYELTGDYGHLNEFLTKQSQYKSDVVLRSSNGGFLELPERIYGDRVSAHTLEKANKIIPNLGNSGLDVNDFVKFLEEKTDLFSKNDRNVLDNSNEKEFEINRAFQSYFNNRANFLINKGNILTNRQEIDGVDRSKEIQAVSDELNTMGDSYESYKKINLPNIYRLEQNKKEKDRQSYLDIKSGSRTIAEDVSTNIEKFGMGATFALADLVAAGSDAVGNNYLGDKLRLQKDFFSWANDSNTIPLYDEGKVVKMGSNTFLVTKDGRVIDKDTKTIINSFTNSNELKLILDEADKTKETDTVFSGRGAMYAMSNTLGNLAFQLLATRGVSGAVGKVGLSGSGAMIGSEMISVGAMIGSSTYNDTLTQLKRAGIKEDLAQAQAVKVGSMMSLVGAISARFLPNTYSMQLFTGSAVKKATREAVQTFLRGGNTELGTFLQGGIAKSVLGTLGAAGKEGSFEAVQETFENYTNTLLNGNVNSNLREKILDDEYTQKDLITDAVMAFGAAGITGSLGHMNNKVSDYDRLATLASDYDRFVRMGQQDVAAGRIEPEEFNNLKDKVDKFKKFGHRIPNNISQAKTVDLLDLLNDRSNLEAELKNTEKVFHPEIKKKIEDIDNKVNEVLNRDETTETNTSVPETETNAQETQDEAINGETTNNEEVTRTVSDMTPEEIETTVNEDKPLFKDPKLESILRDNFGVSEELINALPNDLNITFKLLLGRDKDSILKRLLLTTGASGLYFTPQMTADGETGVNTISGSAGDIQINTLHLLGSSLDNMSKRGKQVLLHEVTHAASAFTLLDIKEYINNPVYQKTNKYTEDQISAYENIVGYMQTYRKGFNKGTKLGVIDKPYGLTNELEFVAEFVSNRKFREWIIDENNEIDPKQSVVRKIWENIKAMLGLRSKKLNREFEAMIDEDINTIFKAQRNLLNTAIISEDNNTPSQPTEPDTKPVNTVDKSYFTNPDNAYRVIVGDEAFDDIVESGVVRTNSKNKDIQKGSGLIDLTGRPTLFPSFSKGSVSEEYTNENENHYIIETNDPSIQPSTSARHGKGTTYFPTDSNGNHLESIDARKVNVYEHIGNGQYELVLGLGDLNQPEVNEEVTEETPNIEDLRKTDLSTSTGLNSFIDRMNQLKNDLDSETLNMKLPIDVARGALDAIISTANTVKVGLDAISAGVDYIRNSDWYKSLDTNTRQDLEDDGLWESILQTTQSTPEVDETPEVKTTEGKALLSKLDALRKGYEKGASDVEKLKKDFLDQVKTSVEGLSKFFSERDAKTLLDQASKVNKDNVNSVKKVIDNLVSRLENRANKARDNKLKTLQKRANVKARTRYGNAGENVRKLTTLPVNQIPEENYDEYYSVMEDLSKGNDVNFEHVNELYEKLKQNIEDYVAKKNEEKANKEKPKPKDNAEALNRLASFDRKNIKPSNNLTDFERKTLKDFKAIPDSYISKLSPAEINRISKALEEHRKNGMIPNKVLTDVVNKYKAERTATDIINHVGDKVLRPVSKITNIIDNIKGREYTSDDFVKSIRKEMLHHIDYAVRGVKGTVFYDNIIHPLTSNLNKADNETNSVAHEFTNLFNRAAKGDEFKLNVKLQMFLRAREYESNPELRGTKVYPLSEHMKSMEANKLNLNMPMADINYIQSVYNDVKNKTSEEMFDEFTPAEKKVVEFMDQKLRESEIASRDYNNHLRGETLLYPTNYFPRKNSGTSINDEVDSDIRDRLVNVLGSTSVKAEQSNERIATGANPLNFNTSAIFMNHIRQSNIENNLAQPLKIVGMTISNVKKSDNASLVSLAGSLDTSVRNLIDAQLGRSPYSHKSRANEIFNTFVKNTFTKVLVDPIRLGYDIISNYSTVYGLHADKLPAISKAVRNIDNSVNEVIHKNISSTQAERLGGSRSSDYKGAMSSPINQAKYRTLNPEPIQRFVDLYRHNMLTKFSEEAGKLYYHFADFPSQHLWKYYTTSEFKRINGKEFDGKRYRDDKTYREEVNDDLQKAVTIADKKTANYFNTGASSEQKLMIQSGKANWVTRFNNFLRSFTFNENRVFWDSLSGLTGMGDSTFSSKSDAFRAFAVVNARGIAYSYLGQIAAEWIVKMVTGDDKEDEEVINQKAMKRALAQHFALITLGNKGAIAGFMGNLISEEVNKQYVKSTKEKYDPFEDSLFFTPNSKSKYTDFLNNLGAEGLAIKTVADAGLLGYNLLDKYSAGKEITKEDLIKYKTAQIGTSFVAQATGLPIDRFGRVLQKYLQAKNPEVNKMKKPKKSAYSGYSSAYKNYK